MPKHVQPTKEQLQAETDALIKDLDTPEETPKEEKEEPVENAPAEQETPKEEEKPVEEVKEEPKAEETPKEEPQEEEKQAEPSPDYKKKFSESSREAQKVVAKNRTLNAAIDEADELPEPTEDEIKAKYPDYDLLDETMKKVARDTYLNDRRFALISKARVKARVIEKWDESVNTFVEDPRTLVTYPALEGNVDEFSAFANKEANANLPFDILVKSYLYDKKANPKPKQKGSMFPEGSGGVNEKGGARTKKLSIEESEQLRKNNYDEYKRQLTAGNISTDL